MKPRVKLAWPLVTFAILLAVLLTACGSPAPTPTQAPAKPAATTAPAATAAPAATSAPAAATAPAATAAPQAAASPAAKPAGPLKTLKIGALSQITSAGLFYAVDKGFFEQEGIKPEFEFFGSGAEMIPVLANGQLDAGIGGVSAGLFNAIGRGLKFKIIADYNSIVPGLSSGALVSRKEVASQIKGPADLKGKTVVVNNPGAPCQYIIGKFLEKGGLTFDDVKVINIPFTDIPTAFQNGAADFACTVEPFATQAVQQGFAVKFSSLGDAVPGMQISTVIASPQMTSDADLTRRFLRAYLKGAAEVEKKSPEMLQITSKYTKTPVELLNAAEWFHVYADGHVNVESLQDQLDFYTKQGLIQGKVDMKELVDTSFLPK